MRTTGRGDVEGDRAQRVQAATIEGATPIGEVNETRPWAADAMVRLLSAAIDAQVGRGDGHEASAAVRGSTRTAR